MKAKRVPSSSRPILWLVALGAVLLGGCLVGLIALALHWQYTLTPTMNAETARSWLVGIIQTQAGILAISLSFSLLYVQISVESYSLRAASVLLRHGPFRRFTFYYVFSLALCSLLAIVVVNQPDWFPLAVSFISVAALLIGLLFLAYYIAASVLLVTPEAIIGEVTSPADLAAGREEACSQLMSDIEDEDKVIHVPQGITSQTQIVPQLRLLIDLTKRMVRRSDHVALQAGLDAITGRNRSPARRHPSHIPSSVIASAAAWGAHNSQEEETPAERKRAREAGAWLAYRAGALLEIWSFTLQTGERIAAGMVIQAFGDLLASGILSRAVSYTDILDVVFYQRLFKETSRLGWLDLRSQVVDLLVSKLRRLSRRESWHDLASPHYWIRHQRFFQWGSRPIYWGAFKLFEKLAKDLWKEKHPDTECETKVFRGLCILGEYMASVGDDVSMAVIGDDFKDRARLVHSERWQQPSSWPPGTKSALIDLESMIRAAFAMAARWLEGMEFEQWHNSPLRRLLDDCIDGVAKFSYSESFPFEDQEGRPIRANRARLDALEDIAKVALWTGQWSELDHVLRRANQHIHTARQASFNIACSLNRVLNAAVEADQPEAIKVWIQAADDFLAYTKHHQHEEARSRLLAHAKHARGNDWTWPGTAFNTEFEAVLARIEETLSDASAEA